MKNRKVGVAAGVLALVLPLLQATGAMAWGPERPTYTNKFPADHAVFNSITDNPVFGDERDFVRIVEKKADGEEKDTYSNDLHLQAGKQYEVLIVYHNNASSTLNDEAHDYKGMAYNAKVIANFPHALAKGEKGQVSAIIEADGTDPASVWDEAYVTADEAMTLHYVTASAKLHNRWGANGSTLSVKLFDPAGDYLGVNQLDGVVLGCYEFSGYITYTLATVADGEPAPDDTEPVPETPIEPTTPNTPVVPKELPSTGPMEITLAVIVVLLLVALVWYWLKIRKAVKKTKRGVKGKK